MEALAHELIPHAPQLGLYVAPDIPDGLLRAARRAFGEEFDEEIIALYDATRFRRAMDGALFGPASFVFQNLVETPQRVAYSDLIRVWPDKKLFGGQKLRLSVNRARATFELEMDFAARAEALPYVQRFLEMAIARSSDLETVGLSSRTDEAIALLEHEAGSLTEEQRARLRVVIDRP